MFTTMTRARRPSVRALRGRRVLGLIATSFQWALEPLDMLPQPTLFLVTTGFTVAEVVSGRFLLSFRDLEPEKNGGEGSDNDSERPGRPCDTMATT